MKYAILLTLTAALVFPGCFAPDTSQGEKHTFFVQTPIESDIIKSLQDTMKPLVKNIITQELGIEEDVGFPFFHTKKRHAITLYYVNDLYDRGDPLGGLLYLFLEPVVNKFKEESAPQGVVLSTKVDFFGEQKPGLFTTRDLVVILDDSKGELAALNEKTKAALHSAGGDYNRAYSSALYDIGKSEKFPYLPHLTIGHLRANYIKYLIADPAKAERVVDRIQQRILKEASEVLSSLPLDERKLSFEKIALFDAGKRKYVHEVDFYRREK